MELHVDRLTLDLPAVSEQQGRRLALLVAARLASVEVPDGPAITHPLSVDLIADLGDPLPVLAERIAGELRLALATSS